MDWTKLTKNPIDPEVERQMLNFLLSIREVHRCSSDEYILGQLTDKSVLDIGMCEYDLSFIASPNWKHAKVKAVASRVVGVDILEDLVDHLNARGYDVRNVDATSDTDLGERFDAVFMGDVIEHVDNPVALLRFAARHLKPNGLAIVSTPNPFARFSLWRLFRQGTLIANFEHVSWVTPSLALEIGRRAAMRLTKYCLFSEPKRSATLRLAHRLVAAILPIEMRVWNYHYIFRPAQPDGRNRSPAP